MTRRIITIEVDTTLGNRIYRLLDALKESHPEVIISIESEWVLNK